MSTSEDERIDVLIVGGPEDRRVISLSADVLERDTEYVVDSYHLSQGTVYVKTHRYVFTALELDGIFVVLAIHTSLAGLDAAVLQILKAYRRS